MSYEPLVPADRCNPMLMEEGERQEAQGAPAQPAPRIRSSKKVSEATEEEAAGATMQAHQAQEVLAGYRAEEEEAAEPSATAARAPAREAREAPAS